MNELFVFAGKSKYGLGLFAGKDFNSGEIIFELSGKKISFQDTKQMGADECYPFQVGNNEYILAEAPLKFVNHSCLPNFGFTNDFRAIAITNIRADEELFFDYSSIMHERSWTMKCACNQASCRKIIRDFDLIPKEIQQKYIRLGIVPQYILQKLQEKVS